MECLLGFGLQPLRELVEHVSQAMDPAALLPGLRPHGADRRPEGERAVADRDDRCAQAAALEVTLYRRPAVGALPIGVLDGHEFLRPAGPHADHDQGAEPILLEPDAEVGAIYPDVHVIHIVEIAPTPGVVLRLPARRSGVMGVGDSPDASSPSNTGSAV